jgi:hypothetical protein
MLYGINGYALQLEEAVVEALKARKQRSDERQLMTAPSPAKAIQDVYRNGNGARQTASNQASFEQMFRAAAVHQPALAAALEG